MIQISHPASNQWMDRIALARGLGHLHSVWLVARLAYSMCICAHPVSYHAPRRTQHQGLVHQDSLGIQFRFRPKLKAGAVLRVCAYPTRRDTL